MAVIILVTLINQNTRLSLNHPPLLITFFIKPNSEIKNNYSIKNIKIHDFSNSNIKSTLHCNYEKLINKIFPSMKKI